MSDDVKALRKQLLANGYTPLPNVGKATFMKGWPTADVDEHAIDEWSRRHKRWADTGIRVEGGLMVLDLDIDHEVINVIATRLEKEEPLLARSLVRFGKGRKEAWFLRTSQPFTRKHSRRFLAPGADLDRDGAHAVEAFGGASPRQFGAFGAHTRDADGGIKIAYEWAPLPDDPDIEGSPLTVALSELPELTPERVSRLIDMVEEELIKAGFTVVEKSVKGEGDAHRVYALTDNMQFDCNDGVVRSLAQLQAVAGETGLRCSASWLEPGVGHSLTRCLIGRGHDGTVTVWDAASGITYLPADKAPIDRSAREADMKRLSAKLNRAQEADKEAKDRRRFKLNVEDDLETAAVKLLNTYAYCPNQQNVVVPLWATSVSEGMTLTAFRNMMQPWCEEEEGPKGGIHRANPVDIWLTSPQRITVEGLRMRPDQPRPTFSENGKTYVNTYAPVIHRGSNAEPERLAIAIEFFEQLLPDRTEREWFLRWLAFKLRHPHIPGPAVVFVARSHGTGRGTLGELVRWLVGHRYVSTIGFDHFAGRTYQSQYTEWLADSLIVLVNESSTSDNGSAYRTKHDTYERLKEVVEPRPQLRKIVAHGVRAFDALVCASIIISTNNPDALPLPPEDRRFWVGTNGEPRDVAFWERVNDWMADPANIAALWQWFEALDLGDYSPFATPPMTAGKRAMMDLSSSDVDRGFEIALANLTGGELMVPEQVISAMRQAAEVYSFEYPDRWQPIAKRMIQNKLWRVGVLHGQNWTPMIEGKRYPVYARTKEAAAKWTAEDPHRVRAEIIKNGSLQGGPVVRGMFRGPKQEEK